jgi:flagellar biosynthesis protein FlhF
MRIKKFIGKTITEATEQMRRELGSNAIILNTRKVHKGGIFNVFSKESIEIIGAIDDHAPVPQQTQGGRSAFAKQLQAYAATQAKPSPPQSEQPALSELKNLEETLKKKTQKPDTTKPELQRLELSRPSTQSDHKTASEFFQLKGELDDLKLSLRELVDQVKYSKMPMMPPFLQQAYMKLLEQDIDEDISTDIIESTFKRLHPEQYERKALIDELNIQTISSRIRIVPSEHTKRRRVVAMVGPTGVGKTTTVAKLAAIFKLVDQLDVGLILADTYRIGAIEQLRTFAAIADIPMEVVYKPAEVGPALRKFRGKDIILLDTVGRSQKMKKDLTELSRFVEAASPDEVHLVLSASTGKKTLLDVVDRFKIVKPNRIVFTKVDEAVVYGPLLSVLKRLNAPLSYITTGPTVPGYVEPGNAEQLASMIYSGNFTSG